ncbi:MAG: hypothetical protein H6567_03245 [Lewinellaceae bacterium]|nr:hypothetical protein [Lewinellaceae bacterium]
MKFRFTWILLFFPILFWSQSSFAQCGITSQVIIEDLENGMPDTTNISLNVSGASINDLSLSNQCVQYIELEFSHPFVKELWFELISPSGQVVQLTGGNITAYNSDFIKWNIGFENCAVGASPDPGFESIWDNDQDWLSFVTYTGTYYPFSGCLEDFDSGPVNGTWTLRCIDFQDFGKGKVTKFNIHFCNTSGIACGECELDPGDIQNEDINVCQGSSQLNLTLDKVFNIHPQNPSQYNYENVIFKDSNIFRYSTTSNFQSLSAGTYTICGLQYTDSNKSILPTLQSVYTPLSLSQYFDSHGYCAAVSQECMTIVIEDTNPSTSIFETICEGSTYKVNNKDFSAEGVYEIKIPNGQCDSIVILNLSVVSLKGQLDSDRDTVGCFANSNSIWITNEGTPVASLQYDWYSPNSTFTFDSNIPDIIDVRNPGVYCGIISSQIQNGICRDTVCKEIFPDQTIPQLTLLTDTITCVRTNVDISVSANRTISEIEWLDPSGQPVGQNDNPLNVATSGWYKVYVTADNGCIKKDSVFVPQNIAFPSVTIATDTLTCFTDSIKISVDQPAGSSYSYLWSGVPAQYVSVKEPYVYVGGMLQLDVTDSHNGCVSHFAHFVDENRTTPSIEVEVDKINCLKTSVNPKVSSNHTISTYQWSGSGLSSTATSPDITDDGLYRVTITSQENGCENNTSFIVEKDTLVPILDIRADSLTCHVDSIQILVNTNVNLISTAWTGPFGFSSSEKDPFVKNKGQYHIRFQSENGCYGEQDYTVVNSKDVPFAIFKVDTLTCIKPESEGILLYADGVYTYAWSGPNVMNENTSSPKFLEQGTYVVTITNPISGCIEKDEYSVSDTRVYPIADIDIPILDCVKDSVQVTFKNTDFTEISINGPLSFVSNVPNPFVKYAGVYTYSLKNDQECVTTGDFEVIHNDEIPSISALVDTITCSNPKATLKAISSIQNTVFEWLDSDGKVYSGDSVLVSSGNTISVVGTAPNQCKNILSITIPYDTIPPSISIKTPEAIKCKKESVVLKVESTNSDVSYNWEGQNSMLDSLTVSAGGKYKVTGIRKNGCINSAEVTVIDERVYPQATENHTNINCKDTLANITINPITSLQNIIWDNVQNPILIPDGRTTFKTSKAGRYIYTLYNPEGCKLSDTLTILADTIRPKVIQVYLDTIDCFNSSVTIGVKTDAIVNSYTWNGQGLNNFKGDSTILVSSPGIYTLDIVSLNFCKTQQGFDVIKSIELPEYTKFTDTLTCDKGKVKIGVIPISSVSSYFWSGPSGFNNTQEPIVSSSGVYQVTITGTNGCKSFDSIKVEINVEKPIFSIQDTILLPCDTSAIDFRVTTDENILRYKWRLPNGVFLTDSVIHTNQHGEYSVQLTGANGCVSLAKEFLVLIDSVPPAFTYMSDTITCSTSTISLAASSSDPDAMYTWISPNGLSNTAPSLTTSEAGDYILIVSNLQKCKDSILVTVPIDTLTPNITVQQIGEVECKNGLISLDTKNNGSAQPMTYQWKTQDGQIISGDQTSILEANGAGTYTLSVENLSNGCKLTEDIKVISIPPRFNEISTTDIPPFCENIYDGRIVIDSMNGQAPYNITVNGVTYETFAFTNLPPDMYAIHAEDVNGCIVDKIIDLSSTFDFNLQIPTEYLINFGDSLTLTPLYTVDTTGNVGLNWYIGTTLICENCDHLSVQPLKNTIYTIDYSYNEYCGETKEVLVKVNNQIADAIPNIFRPRSTQGNDIFFIPQVRGIERVMGLYIFDAWAENVFSVENVPSGDITYGWDGTFNGDNCAEGVYVVIVKLLLADGTIWNYQTSVTLLR